MQRTTFLIGLLLIGCWHLPGSGAASSARAQQWTGTATFGASGGYQSNPYLDPVVGAWDPGVEAAFAALTPQVALTRSGRLRLDATTRARWFPGRTGGLQFVQGGLRARSSLSARWSVGALVGASRYRLQAERDTWWALPAVRFQPTDGSRLTLRVGVSQRLERTVSPTDRQTSVLATLSGSTWLTNRISGMIRLYRSTGQTSVADVAFGGSGAEAGLTYWPSSTVSLEASAALERLGYDTGGGEQSDFIVRGGVEARWQVRRRVTLFARTHGLAAQLAQGDVTDTHASAGVRVQMQQVLAGSSEPSPPRRLWQSTGDGVRFRIPYDGSGQLYLTGDFNGWALPGIPMEPEGDAWTATLDLPPGRYTYRIRVVTDDNARWLDFPPYAQTTDDAFGGTNGVCIVQ